MTETEWLACDNPEAMLAFLRCPARERKLRLLGVAIARASWNQLEDERTRRAVEAAERFADGSIGAAELEAIVDDAWDVRDELFDAGPHYDDDRLWLAEAAALTASVREWNNTFAHTGLSDGYPFRLPSPSHCDLIRDIFGNPLRLVAFFPAWRTDTALALAAQMYASREFGAMPILADALQDAGCEDADILDHCRDPNGTHCRGCWVVDLVLGKE